VVLLGRRAGPWGEQRGSGRGADGSVRAGPDPGTWWGRWIGERFLGRARSPRREGIGEVRAGPGAAERAEDPQTVLLEQVAARAQPLAVRVAGGPTGVMGDDVVGVADRRVAPGRATGRVAPSDHPGEPGGEGAGPRFHGDQLAGARTAVQPAEEGRDHLVGMLLLLGGAEVPRWPPEQGVAHDVGGNAAVALELGGLCVVVPPQQRGVGDDDADVQARAEARLFRAAPLDVAFVVRSAVVSDALLVALSGLEDVVDQ